MTKFILLTVVYDASPPCNTNLFDAQISINKPFSARLYLFIQMQGTPVPLLPTAPGRGLHRKEREGGPSRTPTLMIHSLADRRPHPGQVQAGSAGSGLMGTSLPSFLSLTCSPVRLKAVGSLCLPHCLTACGLASTGPFPRQLCPV